MEYFYETLKKVDDRVRGEDLPEGPLHGEPQRFLAEFHQAMSDDFNFAGALGVVSGLFNELNLLTDKPPVKDKALVGRTLKVLRGTVATMASVLGIFEGDPAEWLARRRDRQVLARGIDVKLVESRIAARNEARCLKTPAGFAEADRIRAELRAGAVEIMDTPQGTTWKVAAEKAMGQ